LKFYFFQIKYKRDLTYLTNLYECTHAKKDNLVKASYNMKAQEPNFSATKSYLNSVY